MSKPSAPPANHPPSGRAPGSIVPRLAHCASRLAWWFLSVPIFIKILGICTAIAWLFGVVMMLHTRATLPPLLTPLIEQKMRTTATWLAGSIEPTLASGGQAAVAKVFEHAESAMPGLRLMTVYDRAGAILARSGAQDELPAGLQRWRGGDPPSDVRLVSAPAAEGTFYLLACPIPTIPGTIVEFGLVDDTIHRELKGFTRSILWTFLLCVGVGTALAPLLTHFFVTRPIHSLVQSAKHIGKGDLGRRARMFSDDEIGRLAAAFNQMRESLIRHRQEIEEKEKARLSLLDKIVEAQEEERKTISRELHDQIGQSLTALLLQVQTQSRAGGYPEPGSQHVCEKIRALIDEVRHLAWGMRPSILDDYGLDSALERYIETTSRHYGIEIDYNYSRSPGLERLPGRIEVTLYRVAQEAITNVLSHSGASRASVVLLQQHGRVVMLVEDNGHGFNPAHYISNDRASLGLTGMKERVNMLGGTCTIEAAPSQGTTIRVQIPIVEQGRDLGD